MIVKQFDISGIWMLEPKRFKDSRGFFCETYSARDLFDATGVDMVFVQDNQSLSMRAGTIRGLHFQAPPHAQAKLVRCGHGRFLDVVVDIRKSSPTFGQWISEELSFENGRQLLISKGFLHGFRTLEPDTEVIYKCDDFYAADCDGEVRFDDPDLSIDWGDNLSDIIQSDKDLAAALFKDFDSPFD